MTNVEQSIRLGKLFAIPKSFPTPGALGQFIPTSTAREYYYELISKGQESIPSGNVVAFYINLEVGEGRVPNPTAFSLIQFHRTFKVTTLKSEELGRVQWYFTQDNPRHISHFLTDKGEDRSLWNVANNYFQGKFRSEDVDSWKEDDMLAILERYSKGERLPPLVLTTRPWGIRPDGNIYIIDGVHRLLAMTLYAMESGEIPRQDAFIA